MSRHNTRPNKIGAAHNADGADFEELRKGIDLADAELLAALNRRASLSLAIGKYKNQTGIPVFHPEREAALLDTLLHQNSGPLPQEHLLAVYREILSSSRALQRPQRVAYLGPEGTFSHIAAQEYMGHAGTFVPMTSLEAVFDAVQAQKCDLGAVPIENSLNGSVGQSLDSFSRHTVCIQAEWFSRIGLSLLSRETDCKNIHTVYSHPQPLGQCAAWLHAHMPQATQVSLGSTVVAGNKAVDEAGSAAIADARLGARLGLHVLARNIEDMADNWTRFFLIGSSRPSYSPGVADKSSIMFSVRDTPGSLAMVLTTLAESGINMHKLESRPLRGERWKYLFFAGLDCDIASPACAFALEAAARHCVTFRVLGTYPAGRHIHATS